MKIGDSCTDGAGLPGTCQPVIDCQSIKDLLLRGNLSDDERTYLMKSQCGSTMGTRTVCCPVPHKQKKQHGSKLPSANECGRSSDNRIVGGEIAELDEYPWLARIQYSKREYCRIVCSKQMFGNSQGACVITMFRFVSLTFRLSFQSLWFPLWWSPHQRAPRGDGSSLHRKRSGFLENVRKNL